VIVAAPAAGLMAPMPGYFDALLAAVSAWQAIDPARVYLIGHSMGGGVVSSWAKARPEQVAGVVSIAGIGSFAGAAKLPRVLAVAGELDPLVTWERTQEQARLAREQGLNVEYRRVDGWGHTLVVGRVLPEAFEWLMGAGREPVGR
jgi:predicted esterase